MSRKTAHNSVQVPSANDVAAQIEQLYATGDFNACYTASQQLATANKDSWNNAPENMLKCAAWSAYRTQHFSSASEWLKALTDRGADDDLKLLTSLLHFEYREYADCIAVGTDLVERDKLAVVCKRHPESVSLKCRFLNSLGLAHYNTGDVKKADNLFAWAQRINPNSPESYINLAISRGRRGDMDGKRRAISEGLVHCAHKDDLQKLAGEFLGDETISLCMIVKNEEKMLPQCLESVSDLVDEIVVVDTGSEDRTVEIARQFGARVFHHPWQDDFSLHRNQSLGYATCDWILIMDADEVLVKNDHDKLRQATRIPDMNVISLSVHNQHLRTGDFTSFLPSVRLWRRKLNAHYEGIVHNELRLPVSEPVLRADIRLIHYGYGLDWEMMTKKIARSKTLLLKQLADNPDNAFANFNYSQILRGEHKTPPAEVCREILDHSGRAVNNSDPEKAGQRHIHLMALDQMASAYFYLREFDNAERVALQALELEPSYLDALFALGNIFAGKRDFARAIPAYQNYIAAADKYNPGDETQNLILIHAGDQAAAYFSLGLVYEEMQQGPEAIASFNEIFRYRQDYSDVLTHLAMLKHRAGDFESAHDYAVKRVAADDSDLTARSILADIYRRQGHLGDARTQCQYMLDKDSTNRLALDMLVQIERQAGDLESALVWIDRSLAASPDDYQPCFTKAEILMGLAKYSDAISIYEAMEKRSPDDAEIANNLGNCYFKLQNLENAVRCYSRALSIEPQMVIALRNLGYTYFRNGDHADAVRKLSNYLDYVPEDFDILYLVSRLYFELTEYADALRYVERCVMLQPQSAELISFLADCYLKLGHVDSAQLGYQRALAIDPAYIPAKAMLDEIRGLSATSAALSRLAKQGATT